MLRGIICLGPSVITALSTAVEYVMTGAGGDRIFAADGHAGETGVVEIEGVYGTCKDSVE